MRLISAIMSFYWSHAIALQKLSNERSYKFSWILTLTEVISFRNLYIIKVQVQTDKSSYSIALRCELGYCKVFEHVFSNLDFLHEIFIFIQ